MRVSGTEPSSVIFIQTKWYNRLKVILPKNAKHGNSYALKSIEFDRRNISFLTLGKQSHEVAYLHITLLFGTISIPYMSISVVLIFPAITSVRYGTISELLALPMRSSKDGNSVISLKHSPNTVGALEKTFIL